jgi:AhpD family alkylhydroperoxidase
MNYQETVTEIQKSLGSVPGFFKNAPEDVLVQMWPLFKKYELGQSVIPPKYREMMALATAAAMKCPYCQTFHREVAKMNGATEQELNELALIVAQTSFWSAMLHTQNYDYAKFAKELQEVGQHLSKK